MNDTITKIDQLLARVAQLSDEVRLLRASVSHPPARAKVSPEASELVRMWIDGCCEAGEFTHPRSDLYARFDRWLENGETVSSQVFYRELAARGFGQRKSNGVRMVLGIRPRACG